MNTFNLTSGGQIDFSVLLTKIRESEMEEVPIPSKTLKKKLMLERSLSEDEIDKGTKTLLSRNRTLDPSKVVKTSKSFSYINMYEPLYKELVVRSNSILVELDLNHCFPQLLGAFCTGIPKSAFDFELPNYDYIKNDLADLFSADIRSQNQLSKVMDYLVSLDNPLMTLYLNKVIDLAHSKDPVIIVDAFGVEKTIQGAPALQTIVMPFSSSINTLAYAIANVIEKKYTYYNKFAFIHKGKMYYYVRNSNSQIFLDSKFYLDGVKLDIKIGVANHVVFG